MDYAQELKRVAEIYSSKGYQVIIGPGPEHLPAFARDFKIEMLATRGAEGVLIAVKRNRDALAADADAARYAEITGSQPDWRFDLHILQGGNPLGTQPSDAVDYTPEEIDKALADAQRLADMGLIRPGVISAWAAFEAAMRMRLRAEGESAGWGTSPRELLNNLYSSGYLIPAEFRQAERLIQLRNQIAHGFSSPHADAADIQFLGELTRRLVKESKSVHQPA